MFSLIVKTIDIREIIEKLDLKFLFLVRQLGTKLIEKQNL